jgi:hypothetical protein
MAVIEHSGCRGLAVRGPGIGGIQRGIELECSVKYRRSCINGHDSYSMTPLTLALSGDP